MLTVSETGERSDKRWTWFFRITLAILGVLLLGVSVLLLILNIVVGGNLFNLGIWGGILAGIMVFTSGLMAIGASNMVYQHFLNMKWLRALYVEKERRYLAALAAEEERKRSSQ